MKLSCWGKGVSVIPNRLGATAYLTARLPDFFLRGDATFSAWARTPQNGRRVILSVESPFHKDSVLEFGTRLDARQVYGYSLKTKDWIWSAADMQQEWMHVALVWNATAGTTTLYADTHARAVEWIKGDDASDKLLASTRDWRLVIGRGKSDGKMRDGWDGEITDVHVWDRALNDGEIRELRRQYPEPVNPSLPALCNDFNV